MNTETKSEFSTLHAQFEWNLTIAAYKLYEMDFNMKLCHYLAR